MSRKTKITAVPIDEPLIVVSTVQVDDQKDEPLEVKTESEQMTELMNKINVEEVEIVSALQVEDQKEEVKVKVKAASKKKPAPLKIPKRAILMEEPIIEITACLDELVAEITLPKELIVPEKEASVKIACPDCNKLMSAKTLKYSHVPNCIMKKQKTEPEVELQKEETPQNNEVVHDFKKTASMTNGKHIELDSRQKYNNSKIERFAHKQKMVDKLVANAF